MKCRAAFLQNLLPNNVIGLLLATVDLFDSFWETYSQSKVD